MIESKTVEYKIMLGCMDKSTIGSAALVHLSPLTDYS
jgi:hypothetical protein